jgi:putative transposase
MYKLITEDTEGQTPEVMESLDSLAREGARRMIAAALEVEVEQYVQSLCHLRDEEGRALVVREVSS